MKALNKLYIFIASVCLCSCAATDYAKYGKDPIKFYLNSLEVRHFDDVFEHKDYGQLKVKEEPLRSLAIKCSSKAYTGKSAEFEGMVISDPDLLYQIEADYIRYLFKSYDNFSLEGMALRKMKTYHKEQLNIISDAAGVKTRCIKEQGWKFLKRAK